MKARTVWRVNALGLIFGIIFIVAGLISTLIPFVGWVPGVVLVVAGLALSYRQHRVWKCSQCRAEREMGT